jgi:hypothetical protein
MRRKAEDDKPEPPDDDLLEHRDAIRLAHKCLKSAVAFHREALDHMTRARDVLEPVCDALDTGDGGQPDVDDPAYEHERAAHLRRVAALRRQFG